MEEARERTEIAELECKLAEHEFSGLLSEENQSEQHSAKMNTHIDENPASCTEAILQLLLSQVVSRNSNPSARIVFPISRTYSYALASTFKESSTCRLTPTCSPPFPVVSSQASMLPPFFSHDHPSTSASASLF